jgi:hypothetical protein
MKTGSKRTRTYPVEDPARWCGVEEGHGHVQDVVGDFLEEFVGALETKEHD